MAEKKVQVRILQGMAGVAYTWQKGSLQTLDLAEAEQLQEAGLCEIVEKPKTAPKAKKQRTAKK